jgi:hypothetical protein
VLFGVFFLYLKATLLHLKMEYMKVNQVIRTSLLNPLG